VNVVDGNFAEAYMAQREVAKYVLHLHLICALDSTITSSALLRYFITTTHWILPTLYAVLRDLRDLAYKAYTNCTFFYWP